MSDPAVEAAQRAIGHVSPDEFTNEVGDAALAAAREALKPIREWFETAMAEAIAEDLFEQMDLLDSLAPLIFTTEELER